MAAPGSILINMQISRGKNVQAAVISNVSPKEFRNSFTGKILRKVIKKQSETVTTSNSHHRAHPMQDPPEHTLGHPEA
jgi:hypothetical protein